MKLRITHEVTDNQRTALNVALNGKFTPLPREDLEGWLTETIEVELSALEATFDELTAELTRKVKAGLGV